MNRLPFGDNFRSVFDAAIEASKEAGREIYLYQNTGGQFVWGYFAPACDPFLLLRARHRHGFCDEIKMRLGCEECEGPHDVSEAAAVLGAQTSEKKKQSSTMNLFKARANRVVTPATRQKMRLSQQARRERERATPAAPVAREREEEESGN